MRNHFRHSTTTGPHGLSNKMFGKGLPPTCTPTLRLPSMVPLNSSSRQLRSTPKFPPESMQASVSTLSTCGPLPKFARSLSANTALSLGQGRPKLNYESILMLCSNSRTATMFRRWATVATTTLQRSATKAGVSWCSHGLLQKMNENKCAALPRPHYNTLAHNCSYRPLLRNDQKTNGVPATGRFEPSLATIVFVNALALSSN